MSKKPDLPLLITIFVLLGWGLFTLASVSFPFSLREFGSSWYFIKHQLLFGIIPGGILCFLIYNLDLKKFKKASVIFLGLNILLILLVFVPGLGVKSGGAKRWLNLGFVSFQPSEFLKLTFLFYLASWLSNKLPKKRRRKRKKKKKVHWSAPIVFGTFMAILGFIFLMQPNLSTFGLIFIMGITVYFISKTPFWQTAAIILIMIFVGFLCIKFSPYRMERVMTALNENLDPLGSGYQLKQSLTAVGSGKLIGIGNGINLGLSRQKFGFLSEPMADTIFAVVGEELGFIGALVLIFLFFGFFLRSFIVSSRIEDSFYKLLAAGVGVWITVQAFFNIAGIIGILPLAGIPLPFFSYGASHLVTELGGIGLLLNASKHTKK